MTSLENPSTEYKPSMWFTTKCLYCGEKFKVLGHAAFTEALNEHRKTCKDKNDEGKPKRKRQTGNNEMDKTSV